MIGGANHDGRKSRCRWCSTCTAGRGERDSWGFDPEHQLLANRGYAVLSVNYRGSTGFGKKFVNAGEKQWAGKMHDDLIDAVDWAVQRKDRRPEEDRHHGRQLRRLRNAGRPDVHARRFACGVDIVGPSNLMTLLETIPPYWGPALQMFKDRVGDPRPRTAKSCSTSDRR